MVAQKKARNKLTERVLRLCYELLSFGFYPTPETLRDLLSPLYDLLDVNTDIAVDNQQEEDIQRWQSGPRYEKSSNNKAMANAKLAGAEIVDQVLNFLFNLSLTRFIAQFKLVR